MHVEIPFTYEALIAPPGSRRRMMATIRDRMTVEIREIGAAEALAVATFLGRVGGGRKPSLVPIELKAIDGDLVEPVMLPGEVGAVPLMGTDYATRLAEDAPRIASFAWGAVQHMAEAFALDGVGAAEVVRSYRDRAVEAVEALAARSAFVDGHLHVPGSEPVYALDPLRRISANRLSEVVDKVPAERIWRADAEDVFLESLARLPADKADEAFDLNVITVHRRNLLTWDREFQMRRAEASRLVRSIQRRLDLMPMEGVVAWVNLRDAVASGDREGMYAALSVMAEHDRPTVVESSEA